MSLSRTQVSIIKTLYPDNTLPSHPYTSDIRKLEIVGLIEVINGTISLTKKGKNLVETVGAIRKEYMNRNKFKTGE